MPQERAKNFQSGHREGAISDDAALFLICTSLVSTVRKKKNGAYRWVYCIPLIRLDPSGRASSGQGRREGDLGNSAHTGKDSVPILLLICGSGGIG